MRVGVGYSENPDTTQAGKKAAVEALRQAGRSTPCDLVLLFATARHDARLLRRAVLSVVGQSVPLIGGGASGAISQDRFGYAGDQVIMAAIWLDGIRCDIVTEGGLSEGEERVGRMLGEKFGKMGVTQETPVLFFYDAVGRDNGNVRMVMATPLLAGIEKQLGFLPDLKGAGLMGDYLCTPMPQWAGHSLVQHHALALVLSGDIRVDSVIMHGCRPATGYYTVTKADRQTILEINGEPALPFMENLLGNAISRNDFPFFLFFGVNQGEKWEAFNETNYASRLCLDIDNERDGIVMFEPDMVAGTEFQIMYRSLDLDYMRPRIEKLFNCLDGREAVFALYIDCAGRAAGYGGMDMEDAVMVQKTLNGRVPLMGIYTGVEIASVKGKPRGLDWTGVFCLFSVSK